MRGCIKSLICSLATVLTAASSYAQPCNHLLVYPEQCPHISATNNSGNMTYDASITHEFNVNALLSSVSLCRPNGSTGAPRPVCGVGQVLIRIRVDNNGMLLGGQPANPADPPINDLRVVGVIPDASGDCNAPPEFSGDLLTGEILAFGFDGCSTCNTLGCITNQGRCTATFNMVFRVTGGMMAGLFNGLNIAADITSENNSFGGTDCNGDGVADRFTNVFNSKLGTKVDLWATSGFPPTACCNPTDGTCVLALPGASCPQGTVPATPPSTTCTPTTCPQRMLCCNPTTGGCTVVAPGAQCPTGFNPFPTDVFVCNPTTGAPCPQPPPTACCNLTTGECTVVPAPGVCPQGTIPATPLTAVCGPAICPQPMACCDIASGHCVVIPPGQVCPTGSTPSNPLSMTCEPNPCPMACCDVLSGACTVSGFRQSCPPGTVPASPATATCVPTTCPQPHACCDTLSGHCFVLPPSVACPQGTVDATPATTVCAPATCPQSHACCNTTTGECTVLPPGTPCQQGTVDATPATTVCASTTCPQPHACCNTETGQCIVFPPGTPCPQGMVDANPSTTACGPTTCPQPTACCNLSTGECFTVPPLASCPTGSSPVNPPSSVCTPTSCVHTTVCCNIITGVCTPLGSTSGGQTVAPCDPNYYPFASSNPLTNIDFNESDVLRATSPANGTVIDMSSGSIKVWYSDEHAPALGVRQVMVRTAGGTTTTNYPTSPLGSSPGSVSNPNVGSTITTGDQQGTDTSGRPLYPSLFITDLTVNGATSHAGDWQYGGTAIKPDDVFGTWKYFTRTVDYTHNPPTVSLTADADPASNPNWNLGAGDPPPAGTSNEAYCTEARWNLASLGLIAGHSYRFYVIVHDGDQNHNGGDCGQACFNAIVPTPGCPNGSVETIGASCNPNPCPQPMVACCNIVTGECTAFPTGGGTIGGAVSIKLTTQALGLGSTELNGGSTVGPDIAGKFFTSSTTGVGSVLKVQRSGVAGSGTGSDPLMCTIIAHTHLDITTYPSGFPMPHDFQTGAIDILPESSALPDGSAEGLGVRAFTVGTTGAGLGLRVLNGGLAQIEGSKEISGGTDGPAYHGNGAPHVDEEVVFTFEPGQLPQANSVHVVLSLFENTDMATITVNLQGGGSFTATVGTASAGVSNIGNSTSVVDFSLIGGGFGPNDVVNNFHVRAVDPNPANPRGTAEHFRVSGFLGTTVIPGCPPGTVATTIGSLTCTPTSCPQPRACCDIQTGACSIALPGFNCPTSSVPASPPSASCGPSTCILGTACCNGDTGVCSVALPGQFCPEGSVAVSPPSSTCGPTSCIFQACCDSAGICSVASPGTACPPGSTAAAPPSSSCGPTTCCTAPPGVSVVVTTACACDWDSNGILDQADVTAFLAAYGAGNADYNGDGVTNVNDFYAFFDCFYSSNPEMCGSVSLGDALCPGGIHPNVITLQYTGQDCSASSNTQAANKFHCSGNPNNASQVYIVAGDRSPPTTSGTKIWFSGLVSLGGTFNLSAAAGGATQFGTQTYLLIYNAAHTTVLSTIDFHTSCSQPLNTGDRFGALRVVGFQNINGIGGSHGGAACRRVRINFTGTQTCLGPVDVTATLENDCDSTSRVVHDGDLVQLCCLPQSSAVDLCGTSGGHPTSLTLKYTGLGCAATHNSQAAGKVVCTDTGAGPNGAPSAYIRVTDSATAGSGHVFFAGTVPLNGTFTATATAGGVTQLATNTYFYIYASQGGAILENLSVHTSCSQPLIPGDQYGTFLLLGLTTSTGASAVLPQCSVTTVNGVLQVTANQVLLRVVATDPAGNRGEQVVNLSCPAAPPPPADACPGDHKPKTLTFKYTGQSCAASNNSQSASSISCTGDPAGAANVNVRVTEKASPTDLGGKIFFTGAVALNGNFTAAVTNASAGDFTKTLYIHVFDAATGAWLQTVKFKSDCSQPLFTGDQFGSMLLIGATQ